MLSIVPLASLTLSSVLVGAPSVRGESSPLLGGSPPIHISPSPPSPTSPTPPTSPTAPTTQAALTLDVRTRGFSVGDLLAMRRVGPPSVAPDARLVAFAVRETDLEANRGRSDIWLVDEGGQTTRLTSHPENDSDPVFSPNGHFVYFLSSRGGSTQVWRIRPKGGEAEQVTRLPLDVGGFSMFPDGERLLLALEVYPGTTIEETVKRDEAIAKDPVKARAYDNLLFRHWDQWEDGKRSHLVVWSPKPDSPPVDLMKTMDADAPTRPFGSMAEIAISSDGRTVVFAAKDEGEKAAWSTNVDLFVVPTDGRRKPERLTAANPAWDGAPAFSPDGKMLAYLAMKRPGYEADRTRIMLLDLRSRRLRALTEEFDRSPEAVVWAPDGRSLWTHADHLGHHAIFSVDVTSGQVTPIVEEGWNVEPRALGDRIVFLRDRLNAPADLYSVRPDGRELTRMTRFNEDIVSRIAWGQATQFSFRGAKGDEVRGFVIKPPFLRGRAPVALVVHGGPQGSMGDHFHYRWNPQILAGRGYGVVFIDFHGSTGYGQAFTDAIREDWGGAPYEDLMLGLDHALAANPWMDGRRAVALGASFGGYMINWINGKTDRFKALVCHDGNLDEMTAYFETEELWFPEWEHGGVPWDVPEKFRKESPLEFVKNWKTPTLVIHGSLDFRVVETQGMGTFTALRRRGIPSRLVVFPDENHWVLKPRNSERWHREVLDWLDRWTKK